MLIVTEPIRKIG